MTALIKQADLTAKNLPVTFVYDRPTTLVAFQFI
jgi:hypothetical protein